MNLKNFYQEWTKIGYPKEFSYEKDNQGNSTHQDFCEIKDCKNNPTIQLYNDVKEYLQEEISPLEIVCKKHFKQEWHLKFAYKRIKDSNGEYRPKYVELKN